MRKQAFVGDFGVCPYECGGRSPMQEFLLCAKEKGILSLTFMLPSESEITDEMKSLREQSAECTEVFFAADCDLAAQDSDWNSHADFIVGEVKTLCIDGCSYPLKDTRECLTELLKRFDGNANLLVRAVCNAAMPQDGRRCDVIRLPDFDGWRELLGADWNAEEPRVRKDLITLTDAWLAQNAVFEVRMRAARVCEGVMARPVPSAVVLRRIGEKRGSVTPSSAADSVDGLLCNFDLACVQLYACGIANWHIPTKNGGEGFSLRYNCKKI